MYFLKYLFLIIYQIHLIDADQDMWNSQQSGNKGVPYGLLQYPVAGIHQDDGQVGC